MEFGARALGNRSILADPGRMQAIRVINDMIKNRDFWMPFASSMLAERQDEYIQNPKRVPSPYMILAFPSTERIGEFRAGAHPYDLTVRPQTVERDWNPDYHRLIELFADRTGKAVLLNTSLNLHGYPMVAGAREALDVFMQSGLCYLALGPYLISKEGAQISQELS
jgi:carbamoyltransferase